MNVVLTPAQMRNAEKNYFIGESVPSIDLMERAAKCLANAISARLGSGTAIIACGSGGNGGDGYAAARMLREKGYRVTALQAAPPTHPDAQVNLIRLQETGVPILGPEALSRLPDPDLWCDALFGTGLNRAPSGTEAQIIDRMNASPAPVVAADVPSGLDAKTGTAYAPTVLADETVCFGALKTGLTLGDGLDVCGHVVTADIGLPDAYMPGDSALLLDPSDIPRLLKPRSRNMHKGTAGQLLIIAGSKGMAGAAAIAANAALRMGTGLVRVACPECCLQIMQTLAPCATCLPLPEDNGAISDDAVPILEKAFSGASALAVGPGLSTRAGAGMLQAVLESGLPAVLDADALNILSANAHLQALFKPHHIITPHPGEAKRLLKELPPDPFEAVQTLAALGPTALLKGASTVISGGKTIYISASGTNGMARGGSGDALTGILGSLLAEGIRQDIPREEYYPLTAALASEIHGLAGEAAARAHTPRAMTAMDIALHLKDVFQDVR